MRRSKDFKDAVCLAACIITAGILIIASCFPVCVSASAGKDSREIVKVGIFTGDGYAEKDKDGNWTGIDIEIIENVAQTAGIKVSFVTLDSASQGFRELSSGRIDMLADIAKTDEREQKYLFAEYEQGNAGTSIFVDKNDDRWDYGDVDQIKTMKFSCEKGNVAASDFKNWCDQYQFKPDIVYYSSLKNAQKAVKKGKADAFIDGEDFVEGYRTVLTFAPSPYYFVFAKGSVKLKEKIDSAMAEIYQQDPLYQQELTEKYFGLTQGRNLTFTQKEKKYIAANGRITVAVLRHDEPYFFGTASDPGGIIPDFYNELADSTGLRFTYKVYDTNDQAVKALKAGEADLIGIYSDGLTQAYASGLCLTRKYISVNAVVITKAGKENQKIEEIAVKGRSYGAISQGLPSALKRADIKTYNTAEACFAALKKDQADAVIIGVPSATYLINQVNSSSYTLKPISSVTLGLCAAGTNDDRTLISIMNKAINASSYTVNGIIADNTVSQNSIQTAVAKIPAYAVVSFAIIMILLVIFLIWAVVAISRSRKKEIAAMKKEAEAKELHILAEAAERNANEKNAFFSNISHDMRTPLNAVVGFAGLAKKENDPEMKDEYLTKIEESGKLLNSLIDDTLTLSKAGSGKLTLSLRPVDTEKMLAVITDSIRSAAEQKGVSFTVDDVHFRHRTVLADELNLEKIFLNLLSNAVKFTQPGGHVSDILYDDPAGSADPDIVAEIRDDGIGMSEEYMRHMYEPFSQEKKHGYESVGTGLGLSIVKQLVDIMGGTIEASSSPGAGTAFKVRLHLTETEDNSVRNMQNGAAAEDLMRGRTVLLCEDNALNREIADAILEEKGLKVINAENGSAGLRIFSESVPGDIDVILMDIRMPVMDGYETTEAIRKLQRDDAAAVPIIAMTADVFADDIKKCLEAGMNAHIAKPIDPETMLRTIAETIL
ncbi:MAG: transporter substrate-binding domain-containing protein [Eubacteriaceae bacterium]|jgi:signal transduction histidine kinase/CheY-like chemotaxis protein/membrane-bound lytic murein transglycosylase MltF|nr:transporter substrate-binding domain-containing protein [Eubacteriaceae bacterium]